MSPRVRREVAQRTGTVQRTGTAQRSQPGALDLYEDPELYDATYRRRRRDVAYYVARAVEIGGPVLEYGAGSGRVALATARAGVQVVGVDASRAMLARLRTHLEEAPSKVASRVRLVAGDMRRVRLPERFPLVTAPFNVVLHLASVRDMERWLARVREHLVPGGELLFDVSVPSPLDLAADPQRWERARPFRHPVSGRLTEHSERFEYDPIAQVLLIESELRPAGGRPHRVPLVHRQWFPRELEAVLHYNGFEAIRFSADFTDEPAGEDVDSLVVSCRPRPSSSRRRVAAAPARH